jgi:hypothetical protein
MADQPPTPGLDEITVATAPGRCLCNSRQHAQLGVLADVIVTFGHLGTRRYHNALWPECWGRSYPLCTECWDTVRQITQRRRPGLVITQASSPPPQFCTPITSTPGPQERH